MNIHNELDLGLNFSALLICMTNIIFTLMDRRTGKPQNRMFICILSMLGLSALCGITSTEMEKVKHASDGAYETLEGARYIYFLTHSMLAPLFFYYISYVTWRSIDQTRSWRKNRTLKNLLLDLVPHLSVVAMELIIWLNPVLHWVWYFDENRDFQRAWGEFVIIYFASFLWMAASFVLLWRSWKILSKNRKYSIAFCYFLVVVGVLVQMLFREIRIELLMEAIGFTGVMLFVENEDERRDVELDVYNPAAFSLDVTAAIRNRAPLKVVIVRDIGLDKSREPFMSASTDGRVLDRAVADHLGSVVERYYIYSINQRSFALTLYNRTDEEAERIADQICARFRRPWEINGNELILTARVMVIEVPERAKTVTELFYMAECPIPENAVKGVMRGSDLDWIVRYSAVEAAVTRGLSEGSFEVYYQPTYSVDKKLYGAEALLRMHDRELGDIYPDEFIPVAEKLGLIDEIDGFVLGQVCGLMSTGVPQKQGVGHINVNLSVIECMKEGFVEQVIRTVESYGVDKHNICFEITESAAATDYDYLAQVIGKLSRAGFMFYIDDFGTGYSNISSLFSLGADIIKIDKSVLWGADKDELGLVLLSGTIKMVKEMHKRTLAEGVETDRQVELLRELGCDYLQGYLFSRPVPETEFLSVIGSR